jgi:glucosamine--fructose-6-phosphate aminotransferase (isomerizing)
MPSPTHFHRDIFRQPAELQRALETLTGSGEAALRQASALIQKARKVVLTGIGASWCACLGAGALFGQRGSHVHLVEAAELLYFTAIEPGAVVIAVSRSGRSIEIVQILAKAKEAGASVIGITNSPDSPLAKDSTLSIVIPIALDYAISVNTYSTLALAVAALACFPDPDYQGLCTAFSRTLNLVADKLESWSTALTASSWLAPHATYYFLARGPSLASCNESRLLWEEGAKSPATAMSLSGFRHGPQETVASGMRLCLWLDPQIMRAQDLAVAKDLGKMGAQVALIGQNLPQDSAPLLFEIPPVPAAWQFVVDMIPMQLAAEALARLGGVDSDSFRFCSYVVEDEHGLLHTTEKKAGVGPAGSQK